MQNIGIHISICFCPDSYANLKKIKNKERKAILFSGNKVEELTAAVINTSCSSIATGKG